jgi:hypothetical protein
MKSVMLFLLSSFALNAFADIPVSLKCESSNFSFEAKVIFLGDGLAQGSVEKFKIPDGQGASTDFQARTDGDVNVTYNSYGNEKTLVTFTFTSGPPGQMTMWIPGKIETLVSEETPESKFLMRIYASSKTSSFISEKSQCTAKYDQ